MITRVRHPSKIASLVLLLLAAGACAGSLGCGNKGSTKNIEDLRIRKHRYNIDETRGLVRVVGEVENTGPRLVEAVEVRAILRSSRHSVRGENMILLEDLKPREVRLFDLTVTSHGHTSRVQLELVQPADS